MNRIEGRAAVRSIGAMVGLIALLGVWLAPSAEAAYHPAGDGRISFAAQDPDGFSAIFTMAPDGSDVTQLTNSPAGWDDYSSAWSPDGRWVAFDSQSEATGLSKIFIIRADGTHLRQVTHLRGLNFDPSWSPDGSLLVFDHIKACRCDGKNIFTVHPDGSGLRQLTDFTTDTQAEEPEFSPDGRWIVFQQTPRIHPPYAIYLMKADGSHIHRITPMSMDAGHPAWSPDGSVIVFNNHLSGSVGDIFTMHPDGTGITRLTEDAPLGLDDFLPGYSPDGKYIVFNQYAPNQPFSILVMDADGQGAHTINAANALFPDWGSGPA